MTDVFPEIDIKAHGTKRANIMQTTRTTTRTTPRTNKHTPKRTNKVVEIVVNPIYEKGWMAIPIMSVILNGCLSYGTRWCDNLGAGNNRQLLGCNT